MAFIKTCNSLRNGLKYMGYSNGGAGTPPPSWVDEYYDSDVDISTKGRVTFLKPGNYKVCGAGRYGGYSDPYSGYMAAWTNIEVYLHDTENNTNTRIIYCNNLAGWGTADITVKKNDYIYVTASQGKYNTTGGIDLLVFKA